jgi:GTP-binding protein
MSQFVDEAVVVFESGQGGNGSASFHREKHVPRGGPNGADGGRGGNVVLVADRGARTLLDFKLKSHYKAANGTNAQQNKAGKDGEDLVLRVPVGTLVTEVGDDAPFADLATDGARAVVARGGRGGRGNLHFTNSVRQAPTFAEQGAPGERVEAKLELKLLADVGLIGLPNAGKSTLIAACSASKAKIGAYPFTTITPNLGVVRVDGETFVMADMPGLIEGASEGAGLGHQFLRHVERTRVLVHVVDLFPLDGSDPWENFLTVESELAKFSETLAARPRIVALNKADLGTPESIGEARARFARLDHPVLVVSGATNQGLDQLLYEALAMLKRVEAEPPTVILRPAVTRERDSSWAVTKTGDSEYEVTGARIERLVAMTNLSNREAIRMLHRKLERIGVVNALREEGATDGDSVRIGEFVFTFLDW